jgi:heme exporter protein A
MGNVELICDNLSRTFSGKTVFKNLNFNISNSRSLLITGRNGSGKSTLIKIIAGIIHSSKGKVLIKENNVEVKKENWFKKIGFASPYLNLYDELTGYENLDFFFRLKSLGEDKPDGKIDFILKKVSLYEKRNEQVKNYSSGMKQRLKLAFAIMNEPGILLLDEPRTNLDKEGVELIHRISKEQKEKGILIIATNDEEDKEHYENFLNMEDYR